MPDVVNGDDKSGSTAVCALMSPSHFYIANCGDSRGVLCRKGAPAVCTLDHKPTVPAERERIQRAGGSVMIHRVNGSLAVSRALGDFEYKSVEGKGMLHLYPLLFLILVMESIFFLNLFLQNNYSSIKASFVSC